jgi:hypothetical protein
LSIFDEVTGRYRAPRLDDLPPPPEPSFWRSAQKGLSDFMDSPWGAAVEIPLTVVTAPQRAVESAIGAFRGGFELSEAEREAYGKEAYDRESVVPKFGGGESVFDTAARRLRGRAYTAPTGGQIARETVAGAGELVGAPSTATVMGLSRDPSQAGGYRPIAESEQQQFERESPVLSRVAAPLRVGTELAGSLATDPTSLLAFGPKLAAKAGGTIAREAAENALRSAALETAKAERLASRLFVPGAAVGALGGTLEAGRAISEEGLFSPQAIEATLGAGVATGMGALATRNAFRGLDALPPPPKPELRWYGFDEPAQRATPGPAADLPPPPEPITPERYARTPEPVIEGPGEGLQPTFLENATAEERGAYTNEVLETARRAYGDQGDGLATYDRPEGGLDLVYRRGGKVVAAARVTPDGVASDLAGIDRVGSGHIARELGARQVQFHPDALSPDSVKLLQKRKATPEVRAIVAQADTADIAQAAGLSMEQAAKGAADVAADAHFEFGPEALAVKRAARRVETAPSAEPAFPEESKPVDLRADPTEPLPEATPAPEAVPPADVPPAPDVPLKLSAEPAPQPSAPAVNVDNIRRAFPTGKITENEGAWDVRLPGNRNIRVTPTGDVEFSLGDLTRGHPEAVEGGALKPGQRVVGSWQRIGRGGLISLAKEAGQGTLDHETFHAAMELVLSERERKAVMKRFGTEEKAADAYGAWTPADKSNAIFAKLAQFFQRLYRNLFPNAESVFGKVRSGEAFNREGTPYPDVPLPARAPAEPTLRESRTVEPAPTSYREFLDSGMDEVPESVRPDAPVTGRRVLPGETPRVEHRVDDIAAATADAGIPETPLKRDFPQSWESLDPKVQEVLRTYDDQKFYDIMSRRNLDAVESQAFDAVIRGKSERLEVLKRQERTPETDAQIAADTLDYIAAQRAYVNDGTGLARALAARARVMSAARPVEAFSRRLEAFRVTPQMAGEVLRAIRKDPTLLDLIRSEARALRLSVAESEGPVKLSAQSVAKLSDRLKGLGLSDEQSNAFVKALREDSGFLPELEAAVKNEKAEPTDVLLKKVFREIKGVSDEQAAEILTAFKENPDNLEPLLRAAFGTSKIRKALEWWRAGLLSSFSTDAANVSGNIAEHHIRLAETGVASALDWMLQKVYGGDRARFAGEVGAEMAGANLAFGPALKNLARNLKDVATLKDKPLDLSRKLEGQFGAIGGTTGKIVRAIGFGRMGAEDVFFKEWGGGAEAMKLAYRKAANSLPAGTSKAEIRARAKQIIDEMADPENTSHADITAAVEKASLERTFQERRVGSLTDALAGVVRRNPVLAFVAPFVNTPGNIANAIIRRSPLGAKQAMRAFSEFKKAQADFTAGKIDQAAFSAARGKLADAITGPLLGTAMLAGFTLYANAGGMTGSGPTDQRAKNALKESGWSPYSFVFTDPTTGKKVYIPFNRFEPVSSLLGFAADMAEAKNVRNLSLFDKALGSVVENLTSKSYLTGLSDAASLITEPKQFAPQYIKGFVGSWVPNIVGRAASAIDPIQRDTRASRSGFAGLPEAIQKNLQSRIPFASQALPARVSSTGAPVERPGNALTRFASPVQPTIEKPERFLEEEYGRLGWAPTAPSRGVTVKGVKTNLTDDEFLVMTKASRRASDEARTLIRSAHYKSLPDDQRELLLDRIYSKWKARGRQSIRAKLERRVAREARA